MARGLLCLYLESGEGEGPLEMEAGPLDGQQVDEETSC